MVCEEARAESCAGVSLEMSGKRSTIAPANQSRLSAESGPPQLFWTARVRAGQSWMEMATPRSKVDWICARGGGGGGC